MEIALMQHFGIRKNLIVPNVTDMSGLVSFETDILVLTKSGYATAIEIKVSKADLKNDLKKSHIKHLGTSWRSYQSKTAKQYYYQSLKHFFYAVPEHLAEYAKEQIPDFCGLLIAKQHGKLDGVPYISFINNLGHGADVLFKTKWTPEMHYDLARLGAMRIQGLKIKVRNLQSNK